MLFAALIYLIAIKAMFFKYIDLVSRGLTFKEKLSRFETCMTYGIKDTVKVNYTFRQRVRNIVRFLFIRHNYKSAMPWKWVNKQIDEWPFNQFLIQILIDLLFGRILLWYYFE